MPKSCFQRKEMLMVRRKVLTFHLWLNLAMEDIFLGRLFLFESVIPLSKLWSLEWVHEPMGDGLNKMAEGKEHKFRGFPEAFPYTSFIHFMATAKEMAMCHYINCTWAWIQVCPFAQCNVRNFAVTSNLLDNPKLKYLFIIFIIF